MRPEEARDAVDEAVEVQAVVTVKLDNGRAWLGTIRPHPTEPGFFTVRTGSRGRPPKFHAADVEDVIFE